MIRKRVSHLLLVFLTCLLLEGPVFAADTQIPVPVGDIYVQDFANVLTIDEENQLQRIGRSLEDRTTAQVAVLTVNTTGDKPIADYANEAFREYGIGSEAEDNGVLLVLAMEDRQVRIEVGYGLEGRIPDGKAGRILDDYATPYLKDDQPNQAVVKTYEVLAKEVAAEYGIEGQLEMENQATVEKGIDFPVWLLIIIIVIVAFLDFKFFGGTLTYFILSILSRGGGRGGGGGGPRAGGGGSSGGGGAGRGW
jgi:uncharacterized protein